MIRSGTKRSRRSRHQCPQQQGGRYLLFTSVALFSQRRRDVESRPLTLLVEEVMVISNITSLVLGCIARHARQLVPDARSASFGPCITFDLERGTRNAEHEILGEAPGYVLRGLRYLPSRGEAMRSKKWRRDQRARGDRGKLNSSGDVDAGTGPTAMSHESVDAFEIL